MTVSSDLLVDSNVLIDILSDNPQWCDWSCSILTEQAHHSRLHINPIVYAELSIGFDRIEDLDAVLGELPLVYSELPREALFLAGKAFLRYRRAGGTRTSPLPDFIIGAHGAVNKWAVITRDPQRMGYHYPGLRMIAPH